MFAFIIGWVIFRAENMSYATDYIMNMFGLLQSDKLAYSMEYYVDRLAIITIVAAILCSVPLFKNMIYVQS